MSLAATLQTARTSLLTTADRLAVTGANIAGADNPDHARRTAQTTTSVVGDLAHVVTTRAADPVLQQRMLATAAASTGNDAILDGLDRLQQTIGDTDSGLSPAARIADLTSALRAAANAPAEPGFTQAVLASAQDLAVTLNTAAATVTDVRNDANTNIAASVARAADLLGKIEQLNNDAVTGAFAGHDVNGILDQRDAAISALGVELGIRVVHRAGNDVAIYTESGVPLFDRTARTIAFDGGTVMVPGVEGPAVLIDGVPVTGTNATMRLRTGAIAGFAEVRDTIAPTFGVQVDEMARGLIEATAETDQSGLGGPPLAGLFTRNGGPALPAAGTHVAGLAAGLQINPQADPAQGGVLARIRDGGLNGADYVANVSASASFPDRLEEMLAGLGAARAFDPATGLDATNAVGTFAEDSIGWLQALRQSTSTDADYQSVLLARASEALSTATGVNLDEEYVKQLQLEQSYAASSKLIGVVDEMFAVLFGAIR